MLNIFSSGISYLPDKNLYHDDCSDIWKKIVETNQEEEDMENDEDKYLLKTEKTATEVAEFLLKEDDENGEGSNFMDSRFKKFYSKM